MTLKKYINNISALQAFQLMRFGTLLLISIVFAKSHLSTSEIGSYEIFLFITALVSSFWINGLIQSFLPLFKSNTFNEKGAKSPEIFNAFALLSLLSLLVAVTLALFKNAFAQTFNDGNQIPFFGFILVFIFLSAPSFLTEYIYLLKNKPGKIINYGLIIFSIQLLAVALPAILGYQLLISIYGLVLVSFIKFCWLLILLKKYAQFSFSRKFIGEHLHFAFPLIVSTLLGSSAQYVDGFLVLNKFDSATFAIFKYGAKEFPLVLLMANALSTAMIADFSDKNKFADSLAVLKRKSARLMHLLFPISVLFLLSSQWLYPRIFNENFTESASVFNIYLLLIISRLVFPHSILIGLKKTKIVMFASLAELVVNVGLSIVFIQFWGIEGIAFATVIAYAFQKIIWVAYNKIHLKLSVKSYVPVSELCIYSALILMAYYLVTF